MTFLSVLFYLVVEPLKLLLESICFYAYLKTDNIGLSIFCMSLAVNLLLLPLYFRADKLEKEQHEKKEMMAPCVQKIKAAFKGDERVMMLQAYYREKHYRSSDVFKESLSLFLQIPFFIAAYSFLSNLTILHGHSLGPVADLGIPDGLLDIGGICINLLPVLMTLINIFSGLVYSPKGDVKNKIKLIAIALVFLVLLYDSPSGLVFYWTLNNIFSLLKNIAVQLIGKLKRGTSRAEPEKKARGKSDMSVVIVSCAALTVLTGLFIPSDILVQNPSELINTYISNPYNPAAYLIPSLAAAAGAFLIWIPLFVYLLSDTAGKYMTLLFPGLAVTGAVNYIFFNKNFGLISNKLIYEMPLIYLRNETVINTAVNILILAAAVLLTIRFKKQMKLFIVILIVATGFFSVKNVSTVLSDPTVRIAVQIPDGSDISVTLSTGGKNVVVIMMDRMIGAYIPYIFNESPEVASQFDGFTYYPNTISFGGRTKFGAPSVFGGYDYTPARINARSDELLVDKHNESLRVLPSVFAQNGWNVFVGDPSLANYSWYSDVSIYDGMEGVNAFRMSGAFNDRSGLLANAGEETELRLNRNLFCYGIMKASPYLFQRRLYAEGSYNCMNLFFEGYVDSSYVGVAEAHRDIGIYEDYISEYLVLDALPEIVDITDSAEDNFFMFSNETTHEICLLSEPEYMPQIYVDNTEYDCDHQDRFTVNGVTMNMNEDYRCYMHYECSMAACMALGRWFDDLRACGVYDNTRIIIVADHGNRLGQFEDLLVPGIDIDAELFNPVLLVKDFGSSGFTVNRDFMTNADTPALALMGLVSDPVNPYTGNPITLNDGSEQLIYVSDNFDIVDKDETQFIDPEERWVTVSDDIYDSGNWHLYEDA